MRPSYGIEVLAVMVEAFDRKPLRRGRETEAFIERWRKKEADEEHLSAHHLHAAIHCINSKEIQNIRELKKYRDGTRKTDRRGYYRKPSKGHGGARVLGGERFTVEIRGEGV